jgi:hypothetical protein
VVVRPGQQHHDAEQSTKFDLRSYLVDPASTSFDWVSDDCPKGTRGDRLLAALEADLVALRPVTLGLMMPTWLPITHRSAATYDSRSTRGAPLLEINSILVALRARVNQLRAFVHWPSFVEAPPPKLYVWEALRPKQTADRDLPATLTRFIRATTAATHDAVVPDEEVLSLVGALLLRTGLSDDITVLRTPCALVGTPTPDEDEMRRERERRNNELVTYLVRRALITWFEDHGHPHHAALVASKLDDPPVERTRRSTR